MPGYDAWKTRSPDDELYCGDNYGDCDRQEADCEEREGIEHRAAPTEEQILQEFEQAIQRLLRRGRERLPDYSDEVPF